MKMGESSKLNSENGVAMRQHRRTMSSQTAASTGVIVTNGFSQMNFQNTYSLRKKMCIYC